MTTGLAAYPRWTKYRPKSDRDELDAPTRETCAVRAVRAEHERHIGRHIEMPILLRRRYRTLEVVSGLVSAMPSKTSGGAPILIVVGARFRTSKPSARSAATPACGSLGSE
jgi:hypothetical protein